MPIQLAVECRLTVQSVSIILIQPNHSHPVMTSNVPNKAAANSVSQILKAAEALFGQKGYSAVSVTAIANKANMSKANVFHHFGNKKELYLAVIKSAYDDLTNIADAMVRSDRPVAEKLQAFVKEHLRIILSKEDMSRLILRELIDADSELSEEVTNNIFGDYLSILVGQIRIGQEQNVIRADIEPEAIALQLIAANVMFVQAKLIFTKIPSIQFPDNVDHFSEVRTDIILHGILVKHDTISAIKS